MCHSLAGYPTQSARALGARCPGAAIIPATTGRAAPAAARHGHQCEQPPPLSRERRVNVMVGTFERWGCGPNAPVLLIVEVAKPQVLAARTLF